MGRKENREIKFRAWDKIRKRMIAEPQFDYVVENGKHLIHNMFDERGRQVEEFELMQYTGLKDKNGKEIYEGDILSISEYADGDFIIKPHNSKVVFVEGGFRLNAIDSLFEYESLSHISLNKIGCIIGNIYENPELLKGGAVKR